MLFQHITEAFLKELDHKNLWLDQDIFNRICSGKIRVIDWRFNHVVYHANEEYEWNCGRIENRNAKEILHFCGSNKPWGNRYMNMADRWWNVAKDALEDDVYEELYRAASMGYGTEKIAGIAQKCMKARTVIIVGYSDHGIFVRNALLKYGITAEIFFCDNNQKKRKLMLTDKRIYTPEEAAMEYKNAIWINVVQKQREEIMLQLRKLKIQEEYIINYLYE